MWLGGKLEHIMAGFKSKAPVLWLFQLWGKNPRKIDVVVVVFFMGDMYYVLNMC